MLEVCNFAPKEDHDDEGKYTGRGVGGVGGVLVDGVGNNGRIMDSRGCRINAGIAVEANGRALKVHAGDDPHLVSLGSDRFSTAVTVQPVPKGCISIGSSPSADIRIRGTAVQELHCWIANNDGIVTISPNGATAAVQIDGVKVTQPSRLTQGCMICLGRSNFFRFNHPQEAKYMRSVLPNKRVSMMPNAFCPFAVSDEVSISDGKLMSNSRRRYDSPDSWYDVSSGASSDDLLSGSVRTELGMPYPNHISPKVFLPGSSTLNSPASVVLGRHKQQPGGATVNGSPFYNSVSVYEDKAEEDLTNDNYVSNQNNNSHEQWRRRDEDKNSVKFSSCESLSTKPRIVPPSPAFNRNPSYFTSKCSSPSNDYGSFSSSSPLFSSSPRFSNGHVNNVSKLEKNGSLSSPTGSFDSVENGGFRKMDSETKRKQAHQNRILEQERERVERLRLEEILTACVDYEKQAQYDRYNKPQIRIKTNGSLPRDKQSMSPLARTPESPNSGLVFSFDKTDISSTENGAVNGDRLVYQNSPRTRIKTVASPKVVRKDYAFELYEASKMSPIVQRANLNGDTLNTNQQSKVTQSADTKSVSRLTNGYAKKSVNSGDTPSSSPNLDSKTLRKYEFLGIDPASVVKNGQPKVDSLLSQSYHESLCVKNEDSCSPNMMSVSLISFDTNGNDISKYELSNFSSNEYSKSKSQTLSQTEVNGDKTDGIEKLNGLVSELNDIIKGSECSNLANKNKLLHDAVQRNKESKFILPLEEIDSALRRQRVSIKKCELKKLQSEQSRLMDAINKVKSKLLDIQQQKDEIIRELEMEKALLEGELKAENNKLKSEEDMLNAVHERVTSNEKQIEMCSEQQNERQNQNKSIVDEQQNTLNVLQSNLTCIKNEKDKTSIMESIGRSREILEEETKSFEDFEFRLLEEEASLLSKRDELQGDLSKISNDVEHTRMKISNLYSQKEQLLQNASDEIKSLELQVRSHTRTLQQNHARLQDISMQLKETSKSFNEIFEYGNESFDESFYPYKTQSQEDLDRISRVTSDAPIMESGSTNSLGRRTIASLQQIERNRQLHLAQQGSQVIEEERKRMLALKQRVQDEVKAQWEEERKQRENNCSSITSIGSDNSSAMSSDRVTESPKNDEKLPANEHSENGYVTENGLKASIQKEDKDDDRHCRSKRPSNVSNSARDELAIKLRTNKPPGVYQRPESRFSVYRRQSLDLRQHIESAGHQLDNCPHVFVDKTSCRGYLQKMTTKFRTWNKRWFVFDRKKCSFIYYNDKNEKKLKGGAYFQGLLVLYMDNSNSIKSPNPSATFVVKSTERVYYLVAPTIDAMRIWFDVLATEIETYQDS